MRVERGFILILIPMIIMSVVIIDLGVYPSLIIDFADSASKSLTENFKIILKA